MKELSGLDDVAVLLAAVAVLLAAVAAASLMFPPPPTWRVRKLPKAEERTMFLEVLMILGLGTEELKLVVMMDVLIGVCEVAGRSGVFIVIGMRRSWLTLAGDLMTVMLGESSWNC